MPKYMLNTKALLANLVHAVTVMPAYGTCGTEAATAAKVVTCSGFVRTTGSRVAVKFTYSNTAATPTLNVNSTGAAYIVVGSSTAVGTGAMWQAGDVVEFIFDGGNWQIQGRHAVLYNNTDGNTGSVTLAKSAANYNYMRIFFFTKGGGSSQLKTYSSADFYAPNGKYALLSASGPSTSSDTNIQVRTRLAYINSTTISNARSLAGTFGASSGVYNEVYIYRVEAWS